MQEFRGLSRPSGSAGKPARFELVRDAGTIRFEGEPTRWVVALPVLRQPEFERA
jgi:hypothetical protein